MGIAITTVQLSLINLTYVSTALTSITLMITRYSQATRMSFYFTCEYA